MVNTNLSQPRDMIACASAASIESVCDAMLQRMHIKDRNSLEALLALAYPAQEAATSDESLAGQVDGSDSMSEESSAGTSDDALDALSDDFPHGNSDDLSQEQSEGARATDQAARAATATTASCRGCSRSSLLSASALWISITSWTISRGSMLSPPPLPSELPSLSKLSFRFLSLGNNEYMVRAVCTFLASLTKLDTLHVSLCTSGGYRGLRTWSMGNAYLSTMLSGFQYRIVHLMLATQALPEGRMTFLRKTQPAFTGLRSFCLPLGLHPLHPAHFGDVISLLPKTLQRLEIHAGSPVIRCLAEHLGCASTLPELCYTPILVRVLMSFYSEWCGGEAFDPNLVQLSIDKLADRGTVMDFKVGKSVLWDRVDGAASIKDIVPVLGASAELLYTVQEAVRG